MSVRRAIVAVAAVLTGVLASALVSAPATFADRALERATGGRVRLADADGSLWSGSARLVLADVGGRAANDARRSLAGVVLPGRVRWTIAPAPLLVGRLEASVALDGMPRPLQLTGTFGELRGSANRLELPVVELGRLGSPWNTILPSGLLSVDWDAFTVRAGAVEGRARIELRDVASAITPVRPLGSYRVGVTSAAAGTQLELTTLDGPLRLAGAGTFDGRQGLRMEVEASPEARERERLQTFMALIGRREGERTIIRIGT